MLLNLVPVSSGTKSLIYGIGQDISERKQMERTLKQAHAELDQIFQTASVGMRVIDNDHTAYRKTPAPFRIQSIQIHHSSQFPVRPVWISSDRSAF